ncbi:uncharacterized protein LOC141531635 isoform X1 [Cotesia typhae]|uniref:uncharacterized protein LOC141531635 isoform X1 n=1 Tax=Cotesia typhae TaxID=2053667 RepID=UPI003D68387D
MFTLIDDMMKYPCDGIENVIKISNFNNNGINMNYDYTEHVNSATDTQFLPPSNTEPTLTENINYISTSYELLGSQNDAYLNSYQNQPVQNLISIDQNEQNIIPIVPEFSYPNVNLMPTIPINDYALVPCYYLVVPEDGLVAPPIIPVNTIPEQIPVSFEDRSNFVMVNVDNELEKINGNFIYLNNVVASNTQDLLNQENEVIDTCQTSVADFPSCELPTDSIDNSVSLESSSNIKDQVTPDASISSHPESGTQSQATEKSHPCKICKRKFNSLNQLEIHMGIHDVGDKLFNCSVCHANFHKFHLLKRHMRIHKSTKTFTCEICSTKFEWAEFLEQHKKRCNDGKKPYHVCSVCQMKLSSLLKLKQHMRTHKEKQTHECSVCKKKFIWPSLLNVHMRIHTGDKRYECDICHVKFTAACNMKKHKLTHTGEKPFQCDICQAKFTRSISLTQHKATHTNRTEECEICKSKFRGPWNLKRHMRIHTDEKPFKCDECQSTFSQKFYLSKHIRLHYNKKSYECDYCKMKLSQKYCLIRHMKIHVGSSAYKCDECQKNSIPYEV